MIAGAGHQTVVSGRWRLHRMGIDPSARHFLHTNEYFTATSGSGGTAHRQLEISGAGDSDASRPNGAATASPTELNLTPDRNSYATATATPATRLPRNVQRRLRRDSTATDGKTYGDATATMRLPTQPHSTAHRLRHHRHAQRQPRHTHGISGPGGDCPPAPVQTDNLIWASHHGYAQKRLCARTRHHGTSE